MTTKRNSAIECQKIELDGTRYVILRESVFSELCHAAGISSENETDSDASSLQGTLSAGLGLDRASLSEKIKRRRQAVGLSQAVLARQAGVRPETLNRIERSKTTPDFSTVRKLAVALNAAERESVNLNLDSTKVPLTEITG